MSRRREEFLLDAIFDLLKIAPAWLGPILAVVMFVLFRFLFPTFFPSNAGGIGAEVLLRSMFSMFSWIFAGAVLLVWVMAEIWKLKNRLLLDRQTGHESIRDMSWRDFERLVCEAYRRKGYTAVVVGTDYGDGGVDIRLRGLGETVLVQCKQWRAWKVGVPTVRELLGVVVSEKADRGIVVTSGRFTKDATAFGQQNPQIELIDGPELAELIRGVQVGTNVSMPSTPMPTSVAMIPKCPLCGAQMVSRIARKGRNAGSKFWGCLRYPTCQGTRQAA